MVIEQFIKPHMILIKLFLILASVLSIQRQVKVVVLIRQLLCWNTTRIRIELSNSVSRLPISTFNLTLRHIRARLFFLWLLQQLALSLLIGTSFIHQPCDNITDIAQVSVPNIECCLVVLEHIIKLLFLNVC